MARAADQAFGRSFMDGKRERGKGRTTARPTCTPEVPNIRPAPTATDAQVAAALDAVPWLQTLAVAVPPAP
jgi:hypothetical protein